MSRYSSAQIKQMHKENERWPMALREIPPEDWPTYTSETGTFVLQAWRARHFIVVAYRQGGEYTRLSVQRTDYDLRTKEPREDISWDQLQRLKGEAGFGHMTAVEVYPPDERVVNVANMRHLFLVDAPSFMW